MNTGNLTLAGSGNCCYGNTLKEGALVELSWIAVFWRHFAHRESGWEQLPKT